jgi:hypothetical protein
MNGEPDFLICIECDSPLYVFEWDEGKSRVREALCLVCGNDNLDDFQTEDEYMGEA